MKKYFLILFIALSHIAYSQKIINAVLVGDKGITDDPKKAKFLIVVKSYADTAFERLEYNFAGPMKRRLTYKDPLLKTLHGDYAAFFPSGTISNQGNYLDNKKNGKWYIYNDTAKVVAEYRYHLNTLLAILNSDSLKLEEEKIKQDTTGEQEAEYKGGQKKYLNFIYKNLKIPERTQTLQTGGTVRARFIINADGSITKIQIWKSVEFAFDEEVMRVILSAKDWMPAIQKGKKVNAYREQPVSLSFK